MRGSCRRTSCRWGGNWLAQANNYRLVSYLKGFEDPRRNNRPSQYAWIEEAWRQAHPGQQVASSMERVKHEEESYHDAEVE